MAGSMTLKAFLELSFETLIRKRNLVGIALTCKEKNKQLVFPRDLPGGGGGGGNGTSDKLERLTLDCNRCHGEASHFAS